MSYQHLADGSDLNGTPSAPDLGKEEDFLRYRIKRLRTILRFARDPLVIAGLKDAIAESEGRLAALESRQYQPMP
jgi:hypothetical protein